MTRPFVDGFFDPRRQRQQMQAVIRSHHLLEVAPASARRTSRARCGRVVSVSLCAAAPSGGLPAGALLIL